jgi:hypothetical protein
VCGLAVRLTDGRASPADLAMAGSRSRRSSRIASLLSSSQNKRSSALGEQLGRAIASGQIERLGLHAALAGASSSMLLSRGTRPLS